MLVHFVMASVPSNGGLNNILVNVSILLSIFLDFAFIFKGFVSFTKDCTLLSERYEIIDAWKSHSSEISRTFHTGNSYTQPVFNDFNWDNTVDWEVSFDFKTSSAYARIDANVGTSYGFAGSGMGDSGIYGFFGDNVSSDGKVQLANNPILNTYVPVSILKEGNKITLSIGDYSIDSTVSYWSNYNTVKLLFNQWGNNNISTVKNIIIKPL